MMEKAILQRTWAILLFALLWGGWMLLIGAVPNLISGRGIASLTFEYRDYLLRMFVVFLVAHLFVRETNFKLLFAIPPITLGLQLGLNVYDFSEWYSRTFRVNLHELNAQLFVVPVQLMVLIVGIVFCFTKKLRSTTRIFATVMMAGSIISTLGFHLAIVNVSYKPIERVYSSKLESLVELDDPKPTCGAMNFDCLFYPLGSIDWRHDLLLDPRLKIAHRELLGEVMSSQMWVRRDGLQFWLGLAEIDEDTLLTYEAPLLFDTYSPSMDFVYGAVDCPWSTKVACHNETDESLELTEYSSSVLADISSIPDFIHVWAHTYDFDGHGYVEPAIISAGRRDGSEIRLAFVRVPQSVLNLMSKSAQLGQCFGNIECGVYSSAELSASALPGKIKALYADRKRFVVPEWTWVDKALSRNPILYINRPEFLRTKAIDKGIVKIFSSPPAFSDITLDLKMTFNLIIGIFSTSWLALGVFLILFHTRRQLLRDLFARERQSATS